MKLKKFGLILAAIGCVVSLCYAARTIAYAKQEGKNVYVYDASNNTICQFQGWQLIGYTSATVTIRECLTNPGCGPGMGAWHYEVRGTDCQTINYWDSRD